MNNQKMKFKQNMKNDVAKIKNESEQKLQMEIE